MKRLVVTSVLSGMVLSSASYASSLYEIIDLGLDGYVYSHAMDISNTGHIAGHAYNGEREVGLFWDPQKGLIEINGFDNPKYFNRLEAVNDSGIVAGESGHHGNYTHSYISNENNELQDINTLGGSTTYSSTGAINNSNQVVGFSTADYDQKPHAYLWQESTGMIDISNGISSGADDINDFGQVVGHSELGAFSWEENKGITFIEDSDRAWAINDLGQAVVSGSGSAFIWEEGKENIYLGTLGGSFSQAYGINNNSVVVGTSRDNQDDDVAFIWRDGKITNLNQMIDQNSGWILDYANDINDSDQIVGIGQLNNVTTAFLLNPTWDALVTSDQTYLSEFLTLGETFSFDYWWEMGTEPTDTNFDVLLFNGTEWETFGWELNLGCSSVDWASASFYVPTWARGKEIQIMFSLYDWGTETNPIVYLRNIASNGTAPVPEPATMLLFGTGLVALVGARLTRKKKK